MDVKLTRRANLIKLIGNPHERGAVAQFAARYNLNPAQVGQVINEVRPIGEKLARKFEIAIGLSAGTLDKPMELAVHEEAANYKADRIGSDAVLLLERFRQASPQLRAAALRILQEDNDPPPHSTEKNNRG